MGPPLPLPSPCNTLAITLSVDSTFIRSCEAGPRHLEVRLGNIETPDGARQGFAAVARTDTAIETLIQRGLAAVGHTDKTDLTAFTDGCSGLRSMLVDAGVKAPPSLDWFLSAAPGRNQRRCRSRLRRIDFKETAAPPSRRRTTTARERDGHGHFP